MNPSPASSYTGFHTINTPAASISIEIQMTATATLPSTSTPPACNQPANNTLTCYPTFYAIPACAKECIATAIEWRPCTSRDLSCICAHSRDVQLRAIPCGENQCSQADGQTTIDYYFKFCVNHGCPSQTSSSSSVSPSSSSSPSPTNSATTSPGTFSTSATASPVPSSSSPVNAGARALSQGAIIGIAFGGFGAMTIILLIAIFFILFRQREGRRCRQPPTTRPEKRMTSSRPSKRAAPPQPLSPTYTHFAGSPMRMRATSLSSPSALITPLPSPVLPSVPPRSPHRDVQLSFPTPPAATTTAQPPPWPFRHSSVQSRIQDGQYRSIHEIDGRSLRNQNDIWTDDLIDEGDSLWRGYEDHYFHHEHDDEDGDGAGTFLRRSSISSSAVLEGRTMV